MNVVCCRRSGFGLGGAALASALGRTLSLAGLVSASAGTSLPPRARARALALSRALAVALPAARPIPLSPLVPFLLAAATSSAAGVRASAVALMASLAARPVQDDGAGVRELFVACASRSTEITADAGAVVVVVAGAAACDVTVAACIDSAVGAACRGLVSPGVGAAVLGACAGIPCATLWAHARGSLNALVRQPVLPAGAVRLMCACLGVLRRVIATQASLLLSSPGQFDIGLVRDVSSCIIAAMLGSAYVSVVPEGTIAFDASSALLADTARDAAQAALVAALSSASPTASSTGALDAALNAQRRGADERGSGDAEQGQSRAAGGGWVSPFRILVSTTLSPLWSLAASAALPACDGDEVTSDAAGGAHEVSILLMAAAAAVLRGGASSAASIVRGALARCPLPPQCIAVYLQRVAGVRAGGGARGRRVEGSGPEWWLPRAVVACEVVLLLVEEVRPAAAAAVVASAGAAGAAAASAGSSATRGGKADRKRSRHRRAAGGAVSPSDVAALVPPLVLVLRGLAESGSGSAAAAAAAAAASKGGAGSGTARGDGDVNMEEAGSDSDGGGAGINNTDDDAAATADYGLRLGIAALTKLARCLEVGDESSSAAAAEAVEFVMHVVRRTGSPQVCVH